jgi:hypothetical protein
VEERLVERTTVVLDTSVVSVARTTDVTIAPRQPRKRDDGHSRSVGPRAYGSPFDGFERSSTGRVQAGDADTRALPCGVPRSEAVTLDHGENAC